MIQKVSPIYLPLSLSPLHSGNSYFPLKLFKHSFISFNIFTRTTLKSLLLTLVSDSISIDCFFPCDHISCCMSQNFVGNYTVYIKYCSNSGFWYICMCIYKIFFCLKVAIVLITYLDLM